MPLSCPRVEHLPHEALYVNHAQPAAFGTNTISDVLYVVLPSSRPCLAVCVEASRDLTGQRPGQYLCLARMRLCGADAHTVEPSATKHDSIIYDKCQIELLRDSY